MNGILHLLGIARKAGALELGEEPVGAAARARQARLILVARDAADNTYRRVRHFADAGKVLWESVPCTKEELGRAVGRSSCAMLALTDVGLASAVLERLAREAPEKYGESAGRLKEQARKARQRQLEKKAHEKNLREGKKRPWAPPPREGGGSARKQAAAAPRRKEQPRPARPRGRMTVKGGLPKPPEKR